MVTAIGLPRGLRWRLALIGFLSVLVSCSSATEKASQANARYQAAMAAGDLKQARRAAAQATRARDDVADYWIALGGTQMALKDYAGAFDAYTRAVELDRTNVTALQTLADLAWLSGQTDKAEQYVDQIDLLQPVSPATLTTRGYIALKRNKFDDAVKRADQILGINPDSINAAVLKARALDGAGRGREGAEILERILSQGSADQGVLETLLVIYRHADDKPDILRIRARLAAMFPDDSRRALDLAEAEFSAGQTSAATEVTTRLAQADPGPDEFAEILRLWLRFLPKADALTLAAKLTPSAGGSQRINLARFLIEAGNPAEAIKLIATDGQLPVSAANADQVAVLAHALDAEGQHAKAEKLFNAVLNFDPTNILALRGRTDMYLATRRYPLAIPDAQRLVAENPASAEDRVRLAAIYRRQGNAAAAAQVYWTAFNDLQSNPLIFQTLKRFLFQNGQKSAIAGLERSYKLQQQQELAQQS